MKGPCTWRSPTTGSAAPTPPRAPGCSASPTAWRCWAARSRCTAPRARGRGSAPASRSRPELLRLVEPGELLDLREPDVVARRVAEARVDAVRTVLGLVDELDAAALELLVGGAAVVRGEEEAGR